MRKRRRIFRWRRKKKMKTRQSRRNRKRGRNNKNGNLRNLILKFKMPSCWRSTLKCKEEFCNKTKMKE